MTQAELDFFSRTPRILVEILDELKKLNKTLAEKSKKDSEE